MRRSSQFERESHPDPNERAAATSHPKSPAFPPIRENPGETEYAIRKSLQNPRGSSFSQTTS